MPVLSAFGDLVVHVGALGSGQLAKLLNNLLLTATLGLAHETAEFAGALGVDEAALMSILPHASGRSYAVQMYAGLLSCPPGTSIPPVHQRVRFSSTAGFAKAIQKPKPPGLPAKSPLLSPG